MLYKIPPERDVLSNFFYVRVIFSFFISFSQNGQNEIKIDPYNNPLGGVASTIEFGLLAFQRI